MQIQWISQLWPEDCLVPWNMALAVAVACQKTEKGPGIIWNRLKQSEKPSWISLDFKWSWVKNVFENIGFPFLNHWMAQGFTLLGPELACATGSTQVAERRWPYSAAAQSMQSPQLDKGRSLVTGGFLSISYLQDVYKSRFIGTKCVLCASVLDWGNLGFFGLLQHLYGQGWWFVSTAF